MYELESCHSEYSAFKEDWKRVRDCIKGQTHIKSLKTCYLPKTSGMVARSNIKYRDDNGNTPGELQYEAYRERARFPNLVGEAESGIIGLSYDTDPINDTPFGEDAVTVNGRDVITLSRDVLREVLEAGTSVLVVDAPSDGGDPYIVQYPIESVLDWAVDDWDNSKLTAVKFKETYYAEGDVFKENELTRYRIFLREENTVTVSVKGENGETLVDDVTLPVDYIPVFFIGSIDTLPTLDPIPLLPIAHAAVRIYQISADHAQFVHGHGQGTHWATGLSPEEEEAVIATGVGVGSMLFGPEGAEFGLLQMAAGSDDVFLNAIKREEKTASSNAVALISEGAGVEAAESVRIRAASQHATIYTILWSVSEGLVMALESLAQWAGRSGNVEFMLQTDFTDVHAAEQLINHLDKAILSGNAPRSAMFNVLRSAGLTEKTDDEIEAEILDGGAVTDNDSENDDD